MKRNLSFEAFLKHPSFSKDLAEKVSQDITCLEKEATGTSPLAAKVKHMLPLIGGALGASAVAGTYGYFHAKKKMEDQAKSLSDSYNTLLVTHKPFSNNPEEFRQRFTELSLISPTVAMNPRLAQNVIQPRLTKGFDLDDVHRLSAIEHHTSTTPKLPSPAESAQEHASTMLGRNWSNILFPLLATQSFMAPVGKDIHTIAQKAKAQPKFPEKPPEVSKKDIPDDFLAGFRQHKKEGSGGPMDQQEMKLLVSEECLGRMLADRYQMFKTAGILPPLEKEAKSIGTLAGQAGKWMGKAVTTSTGQVGKYIQMMAVPLMIGGGIQLINHLRQVREADKMNAQADQVFSQLKKTNDNVRENLPVAQEAFDTLKSFAPALAAKPLVARTFVEHVISSEGRIPPDTTQMLANTQKMINQLNEATGGGFIEGLKSPMGLFKHTISQKGKKES
jgi:hypothetical protein